MLMKISLTQFMILLVFGATAMASGTSAQELLARSVTLNVAETELKSILNLLEKQADVKFAYSQKTIRAHRRVSLNVSGKSLSETLSLLLNPLEISYEVLSGRILLLPKPAVPDRGSAEDRKASLRHVVLTDREIHGAVTDGSGAGLPGVNIVIKGTQQGTVTDAAGRYTLLVPDNDAILIFSFVGYVSREIAVGSRTVIDVLFEEDKKALGELVVIGYQTVRRGEVSTAISSVGEKDIRDIPVLNIAQSLVGKMAGITLQQTSGAPGVAPAIRIRGSGSISNGNNPLYVIDGYPTSDGGMFNSIPPSDIESIDVLKDAAAAAIYGSRAGNGVVVVTTKRGKSGTTRFSLDVTAGVEKVEKKYKMMDAGQYVEMAKEALMNQNMPVPAIFNNPDQWVITDWHDAIFRRAAYKNYQLGASGGNEKIQFSIGGGYSNQEGTLKNTSFERYNARFNIDAQLNSKLRTGINILPTFTKSRLQTPTGGHNTASFDGIIATALSMPPILPVFRPNGDYFNISQSEYEADFNPQLFNPVQKLDANLQYQNYYRMTGSAYLEYEPVQNLKFRSAFNVGISGEKYEQYIEPFMAWNTNGEGNISTPNLRIIDATRRLGLNSNQYWSNTMSYFKNIRDRHSLTFLLGYDAARQDDFNLSVTPRTDASNPVAFTNTTIKNVMGAVLRQGTSSKTTYTFDALFGRVMYSFSDRYTFSASLRQDRSSRFGPLARAGIFPSFSGAWRISDEDFLRSATFLNDLKIRASYGVTGNDQLSNYYPWLATLSQGFYVFGEADHLVQTFVPSAFTNQELNWEKNKQTDIGLDVSFFNNRFQASFDLYQRNSNAILAAAIPSLNGIANSVLMNVGNIRNRGLELSLNTRNLTGSVKWNTMFNISVNRNRIISLGDNQTKLGDLAGGPWGNVVRNYVGRPMGDLYLYEVEGIFNNQQELDTYPKLGSQAIGDLRFRDINGDDRITTDDMTLVGNYQPDFTFGITNSLSCKAFELSIVLQGNHGGKVINAMERQLVLVRSTENSNLATLNRWKSESEPGDGLNHRAGTPNLGNNIGPTTRFLYDAGFARIRNVTVSYQVPEAVAGRLALKNARAFVTGQNLFTFTKYSGYNPEGNLYGNSAIQNGIDQGTYPLSRNISIGLNLGF